MAYPSDPGGGDPFGPLGPSVPGGSGAGTPVDVPSGSAFTLYVTMPRSLPLATLNGVPFSVLTPTWDVGPPTLSGDGRTIALAVRAKRNTDKGGAADGLLSWLKLLGAASLAAGVGVPAGISFVQNGGPGDLGRAAAGITDILAQGTGAIANVGNATGGIVPLLVLAAAAYLVYEVTR